ncbi:MAG: DUF4249 family protein [Bacteroidales bacterium]|nr:DUF4249 family protein [Bacteroidales bacterium]
MSHKYRIIRMAILAFLLLTRCEEQSDIAFQLSQRFMVADCIITNEFKNHELKLYWSNQTMNGKPEGIEGAVSFLTDGIHSVFFKEDSMCKGLYKSELPFRASAGLTYRLVVSVNGISDTAYAEMTGIAPFKPVEIVPDDSLFRFVYKEDDLPSMTEMYYDWSKNPDFCQSYGSCHAAETFYTLNNIDIGAEFAPEKQKIRFPRKTILLRKKFSLTEEHQRFLRSLLLETEWRGGIFDVEQGSVPSGFQHGVKGFFAACMVLSDTTFFE